MDIEKASGEMHDSEFTEEDFGYDHSTKTFYFKSHLHEDTRTEFFLELYNVEKYTPLNLDRIKEGKATGGVLNDIKVKNHGLNLILISQDLNIQLELSNLEGKFEKTLTKGKSKEK